MIKVTLIKRYKRFLADVTLSDGRVITVHCPNSGSMKTCFKPGWPALISDSQNPNRKLRYTLEQVYNGTCWICVNTHRANGIVEAAIRSDKIPQLQGYATIQREVKYAENSRIDLLLSNHATDKRTAYLEVKTVTLLGDNGTYQFPDAVTTRGQKHIDDLLKMHQAGHRAILLFLLMRSDGTKFEPAAHIDPVYAEKLKTAKKKGLEVIVIPTEITEESINIRGLNPL